MKIILVVMTFLSSLFGANAQKTDNSKILNSSEFNKAITTQKVQLVDVRTSKEFDQGAIEGAINIDYFQQDTFAEEFSKLDKSKPLYIYCRSGKRSQKSAMILKKMGFIKIFDLKGGYKGWPYKK